MSIFYYTMKKYTFIDTTKLQEMLSLRSQGWSYLALAHKFKTYDHAAIRYHCMRHNLPKKVIIQVSYQSYVPKISNILQESLPYLLSEEEINPGKSYKQYLLEASKRTKDLYHATLIKEAMKLHTKEEFTSYSIEL